MFAIKLFVRGSDDRIYENIFGSPEFNARQKWSEVPGNGLTRTELAAVRSLPCCSTPAFLFLFARGTDNRIYENRFDERNSTWSGWMELPGGGLTLSGPAAVQHVSPGGRSLVSLFVRGTDTRIYEQRFDGSNWLPDGWLQVPGDFDVISAPAAVRRSGSDLRLFVRALDNHIYYNDFGTAWSQHWSPVPDSWTIAAPSAVVPPIARAGALKLFITGVDDTVWENDFDGRGWIVLTFNTTTPSGPAADEGGNLWLTSEDGRILTCNYPNSP